MTTPGILSGGRVPTSISVVVSLTRLMVSGIDPLQLSAPSVTGTATRSPSRIRLSAWNDWSGEATRGVPPTGSTFSDFRHEGCLVHGLDRNDRGHILTGPVNAQPEGGCRPGVCPRSS